VRKNVMDDKKITDTMEDEDYWKEILSNNPIDLWK
jgi:hypothetical protein